MDAAVIVLPRRINQFSGWRRLLQTLSQLAIRLSHKSWSYGQSFLASYAMMTYLDAFVEWELLFLDVSCLPWACSIFPLLEKVFSSWLKTCQWNIALIAVMVAKHAKQWKRGNKVLIQVILYSSLVQFFSLLISMDNVHTDVSGFTQKTSVVGGPSLLGNWICTGFCWSLQRSGWFWMSHPNRLSPDPLKLLIWRWETKCTAGGPS